MTGTIADDNSVATQARADETNAYNILAALPSTSNLTGIDMAGLTLTPGVYTFANSAQLSGTLVLNFAGASNEDFVFQIGSTLTTASASSVTVENGNSTDGVFFQVGSSATLGSSTVFEGNILALDTVSFDSSAELLCGRAFGQTAAVTLIGNTISNNCMGSGTEGTGATDFASDGYSGGDFTSLGYTGGGFNGVPFQTDVLPVSSAIPEPSSFALLGVALLALSSAGFCMRKRASSKP
jgi:type VI secretion system secreted protein VgrG